jgi:hypothetical protein
VKTSPTRIASRLVDRYQPKVLPNSRPTSRPPPIDATPETTEVSTSGTITMRSRRTNSVPIQATRSASASPPIAPAAAPTPSRRRSASARFEARAPSR